MCFFFPDRSCPNGDGGAAFNETVRCGFPAHWWALAENVGAPTAADAGASANARPVQCLLPRYIARIHFASTRSRVNAREWTVVFHPAFFSDL